MKLSKLHKMIREELEDAGITEDSLEASINEYFKLQENLKSLEAQLAPLLKSKKTIDSQQERILKAVQTWMEVNKKDNVVIKNWVVKLSQVLKFKVPRPDYKTLWEDALRKVNESTRNILNGYQDAQMEFKKSEKIPSLTIEPVKEVSQNISNFSGLLKAAKASKELHAIATTLPAIQ